MSFEPIRQRVGRLRAITLKDVLRAAGEPMAQAMRARHPAVQRLRPPRNFPLTANPTPPLTGNPRYLERRNLPYT